MCKLFVLAVRSIVTVSSFRCIFSTLIVTHSLAGWRSEPKYSDLQYIRPLRPSPLEPPDHPVPQITQTPHITQTPRSPRSPISCRSTRPLRSSRPPDPSHLPDHPDHPHPQITKKNLNIQTSLITQTIQIAQVTQTTQNTNIIQTTWSE